MSRGQGKGPLGQPRKEMFAADFPEQQKVEKTVDMLVDSAISECPGSEPNEIKNTPSSEPEEELSNVHGDIAGYGDPDDIEDEYPPADVDEEQLGKIPEGDMADGGIGSTLESIFESEYQKFFKKMLDKEGIKSIGDLSDSEKKAFFNRVDKMWKGKNESLQEKGEYQTFFKRMMDEEGVSSIAQMSHDQKSSFFSKVSAKWKKEKGKSVAETFSYLK